MAFCTVVNSETSAGNDPEGGIAGLNPRDGGFTHGIHLAESTLLSVTAELKGWTGVPPNDGISPQTQIITGTITRTPIFSTGFLVAYKNTVSYSILLPFIDNLFQGLVPLVAPFSVYWSITEMYQWNAQLQFGSPPPLMDRYSITRKVCPLVAGGPTQVVSAIMV